MKVIKSLIKRCVLLVLLSGVVFNAVAQNSTYISNHKIVAALLAEHYGIPAPVILAVAAVESSGGAAPVARVLNNHFGVVGKNNFVNQRGHKSRYKQYDNELASYIDFCQIITRKKFYKKLKDNEDCRLWVKALSKAGYSELPGQWEKKVFGVLTANTDQSDESEFASR